MGRPNVLARIAVLKLALLVPALLVGVRHGLVGVALAHLVTTAIVKSLRAGIVARMLQIRPADLGRQFLPTLAAGTVMAAVVAPVLAFTTGNSPVVRLLLAVSTGAASYVAALVALEGASLRALLDLFRPRSSGQPEPRHAED
jgi:hypothetical protein